MAPCGPRSFFPWRPGITVETNLFQLSFLGDPKVGAKSVTVVIDLNKSLVLPEVQPDELIEAAFHDAQKEVAPGTGYLALIELQEPLRDPVGLLGALGNSLWQEYERQFDKHLSNLSNFDSISGDLKYD